MKKFTALFLALLMMLSFAACGTDSYETLNFYQLLGQPQENVEKTIGDKFVYNEEEGMYCSKNGAWKIALDGAGNVEYVFANEYVQAEIIGLTMFMNYDDIAEQLEADGYTVTTEESRNALFFECYDEPFAYIGMCTFDPADQQMLSISADSSFEYIINWAKDEAVNADDETDFGRKESDVPDITTYIGADKDTIYKTFSSYNITESGPEGTELSVSDIDTSFRATFYIDYATNKVVGCRIDSFGSENLGMKYGMQYEEAKTVIKKHASDIYEYNEGTWDCIAAITDDNKYLIDAQFDDSGVPFEGKGISGNTVLVNTKDLSWVLTFYRIPFAIFGEDLVLTGTETNKIEDTIYTYYNYETKDNTVKITLGEEVSIIGDCEYNIFGAEYGMDIETAKNKLKAYGYEFGDSLTATTAFGTITIKTDSNNSISEITYIY